jgi:hypothetical protein
MRWKIAELSGVRQFKPAIALAYVALIALFAWTIAEFYIPGKGFTALIVFGDKVAPISKVGHVDYFVERYSGGYDAQFYAQIAMDPSLQNQALKRAVDSLAYRARRILFCATAYAFGFGDPPRILQVYALQNAFCWLGLAFLLLHWFPPVTWNNFLRWAGILFSLGVCVSARNALVDGPSLLLIVLGVFLLEKKRPWMATVVMAFAGLGKETNLLAAAALIPDGKSDAKAWGRAIVRGLLVAAPLALWLVYISYQVGPATDVGIRNFDLPFAGYLRKWREIGDDWSNLSGENYGPIFSVLMMLSLTVQFLYLVLRPQWTKAWWRIGASFALLMVFLGQAVWEGYPGAASRVLLPMQMAFNVLVPLGRGWTALLIAGNLTLLIAPSVLQPPAGEGYDLVGKGDLLGTPAGKSVLVAFSPEWYGSERNGANYWSWAPGTAALNIRNPHDVPLLIRLRFSLSSMGDRTVWVRLNGQEIWRVSLSDDNTVGASLSHLSLVPGANRIEFATDAPSQTLPPDTRHFAFCLHNLRIDLQDLDTGPPVK